MKVVAAQNAPYLGVFTSAPATQNAQAFKSSGANPAIVHVHSDWTLPDSAGGRSMLNFTDENPLVGSSIQQTVVDLSKQGQILAVSWDPMSFDPEIEGYYTGEEKPAIGVQAILDGTYDDYIREVAQQTAALDTPLMMTLFGEVNSAAELAYGADGASYRGVQEDPRGAYGDPALLDGPERMKDVFKHVIDIFRAEGADNVTWYMYMASDYMANGETNSPDQYYPGDEYIDWVGQSVYSDTPSGISASLDAGYAAWDAVSDNPFFIPEFGITQTDDPNALQSALSILDGYDNVGAVTISDFPAAEEVYGVPRLGSREGDWDAIQNSGWENEIYLRDGDSDPQLLTAWRDVTGRSADDYVFVGTEGADFLSGSVEDDTFIGYTGDDIYLIEQTGDRVVEVEDEGYDVMFSLVSTTLADNVEMLLLDGGDNIDGTGTAFHDYLIGNAADNVLTGLEGADTLTGGGGSDTLIGGQGDDFYIVDSSDDSVIELSGGGVDVVSSGATFTMSANLEILILDGTSDIGATGASDDNTIMGNTGNNDIDAGDGNDMVIGDAGDDLLRGGAGIDFVDGGAGDDTLSGGTGDDIIFGGDGDDRIAMNGSDLAIGGAGADTFIFAANSGMGFVEDYEVGVDRLDLNNLSFETFSDVQDAAVTVDNDMLLYVDGGGTYFLAGVTAESLTADDVIL
ncbi:hypothetical protein [Primorskyibacter sp. S187A]|uniref:hypothetical protein n=1 Tax=Primorskyibacter sp. S187A TaxID=3415130 RepID=UPI003C79EBC6